MVERAFKFRSLRARHSKKLPWDQAKSKTWPHWFLEVGRWERMSDDKLIAELTQVRGIGRWTAEMFLIFYMTRPDVMPVDDIGHQRAPRARLRQAG